MLNLRTYHGSCASFGVGDQSRETSRCLSLVFQIFSDRFATTSGKSLGGQPGISTVVAAQNFSFCNSFRRHKPDARRLQIWLWAREQDNIRVASMPYPT